MKVKLADVYASVLAVSQLQEEKMKIVTAFKIRRIASQLQSCLDDLEASRVALVHELDTESTGRVPAEKLEYFEAQMQQLFEEEIEITGEKLSLDELASVTISPLELGKIMYLIED